MQSIQECRPVSASNALLVQRLHELALEGCRDCVQSIAHGRVSLLDGQAVCNHCGGELHAGLGHQPNCLTLRARGMIRVDASSRPRSGAQPAPLPLYGLDIDAIHGKRLAHAQCPNCHGLRYRREANGEPIPCDLCETEPECEFCEDTGLEMTPAGMVACSSCSGDISEDAGQASA